MYFLRFHLVNGTIIDEKYEYSTVDECIQLAEYVMRHESITIGMTVINVKNVIMIQVMEKPEEELK